MKRCEGCSIMTDDFVVYFNEEDTIKCRKCYNKLMYLNEYLQFCLENQNNLKHKKKEHDELMENYHLLFDCK